MVLRCDLCKEVFFERSSLRRHLNTKRHIKAQHSDASLGAPKSSSTHQCDRCDKSFARADALTRHRLKHTGYSAKCFLCSKALRRDDLKRHEPVCVSRHLDRLRKSANIDTSNGLVINQAPLEFQWDPTARESFSTKEEAFLFVRRRTNDLNAATQELGDLVSYAIDRDALQMCEAVCAVASSLSISFTDMAKRLASRSVKDQVPDGRFWYLKLLLRGETNIGTMFDMATIRKHARIDLFSGGSPLHLACYQGFPEITKSLILSGADVNLLATGNTPLCLAVGETHLDIVRILLSNGAKPNKGLPLTRFSDAYLWNYGHRSIVGDIAATLIESGAAMYFDNDSSSRALLRLAISSAHIRLLRSIIARSPPRDFLDSLDFKGDTALHEAARKGFLEGVQLLMNLDTEATDQLDRLGQTPLLAAMSHRQDTVVQCLLAAENRHSKQTLDSALLRAIWTKQSNNIRLLIKAGAVLTEVSNTELLHFIIPDRGEETIELLLDEGTRVDLLSEACIDILLERWIEYEFGDSETRNESAPNIDMLRRQYTVFGRLPSQVVGTDRADTV